MFVNATLDEVAHLRRTVASRSFSSMATRGRPTASEAARRTGCRVIKAARVHDAAQVQALRA